MSRYIDADRLIYELNRRGIEYRADIDEVIRATPTADVEPVRHGKWIDKQEVHQTAICYNCKKVTMQERWGDIVKHYNYCPNCGAKMDKE